MAVSPKIRRQVTATKGGGAKVLRQMVSGTQALGQSSTGYATGYTRYESRKLIATYGRPLVRPRIAIPSYYLLSGLIHVPNAFNFEGGIEYNGAFFRCRFGNQNLLAMAQNAPMVMSDPLEMTIPAAATAFLQSGVITAQAAHRVPSGVSIFPGLGEFSALNNSATSQIGSIGGFTANGGVTASKGFCPLMVVGETDPSQVVVSLAGDSIFNEQDLDTAPDAYGNVGFAAKGAALAGVPFIKINRTALRIGQVTPSLAPEFYEHCAYVTDYITDFVTNDINNGATLAQLQTNKLAEWAEARARGAKRVHQMLCLPCTIAGNTAPLNAVFQPGGLRDQCNAWFLTKLADGTINGILDMNVIYESQTTPGLWADSAYTTDGTHPNNVGAEAGKGRVRDYIIALPPLPMVP